LAYDCLSAAEVWEETRKGIRQSVAPGHTFVLAKHLDVPCAAVHPERETVAEGCSVQPPSKEAGVEGVPGANRVNCAARCGPLDEHAIVATRAGTPSPKAQHACPYTSGVGTFDYPVGHHCREEKPRLLFPHKEQVD
jgi:hypothetical protein